MAPFCIDFVRKKAKKFQNQRDSWERKGQFPSESRRKNQSNASEKFEKQQKKRIQVKVIMFELSLIQQETNVEYLLYELKPNRKLTPECLEDKLVKSVAGIEDSVYSALTESLRSDNTTTSGSKPSGSRASEGKRISLDQKVFGNH